MRIKIKSFRNKEEKENIFKVSRELKEKESVGERRELRDALKRRR